jgi:hypothetical protein
MTITTTRAVPGTAGRLPWLTAKDKSATAMISAATMVRSMGIALACVAMLSSLTLLNILGFTNSVSAFASSSTPRLSALASPPQVCNALDIAMLEGFYPNALSGQIAGISGVASVDTFDTYATTPTLAQLQPYDMVVIAGSGNHADRVALGNVLADYVDGGGVVVHSAFETVSFSYLQGRWLSGNYSPYAAPAGGISQNDFLGTYNAAHPLMQGVGNLIAANKIQAVLTTGAEDVARYYVNSSLVMVAAKGRVVGLNAGLSGTENQGGWSANWSTVIVNAANWIYNCPPPTTPTVTPTRTNTPLPTNTPVPTNTPMPTVTGTPPTATATPIPQCTIEYTDVPLDHPFYVYIKCLACAGVVGGYEDGTFRPGNNITRGQLSKIVSNAAGFTEPVTGQTYADVEVNSTFYDFVERLTTREIISGYECGMQPGEPCDAQSRPYFRVNANATRGQISKIISNAAGFEEDPGVQLFTDVPMGSTFYAYINRLSLRGIISGYECGTQGEPCDSEHRPYFRAANNATRGQTAKIVGNTFYAECTSGGSPHR